MDIDVKIMLKDRQGQPFMGIGLIWLLAGISRHHSISSAAREMELSYPKALRLIKNAERGLGQAVVIRHKGGQERGGAELTAFGREFLQRYDRLQQQIRGYAEKIFRKSFITPFPLAGKQLPANSRHRSRR